MTPNEFKNDFLLVFDNLFQFGAPAYDDAKISRIATKAHVRVFNRHYTPILRDKGFEATEERRATLSQFIKAGDVVGIANISASSDQNGVHPNGVLYDMPDDLLYLIDERIITSTSNSAEILVKPVTHDEYQANINNPYKKPYAELTWRMDMSRLTQPTGTTAGSKKRVELITDGATITNYKVRYLSTPPDIVVDTVDPTNQVHFVVDPILHDRIVDEAVNIAKASVDTQEYPLANKEKQENDF